MTRRPSEHKTQSHLGASRTDGVLTPFREGVAHASLLSMNSDQGGTRLAATRAVERDSIDNDGVRDLQLRHIRLMVVDDHPAVRLGVVQLLEGQRDFSVEVVCIDAESAVAQAELQIAHTVVID